MSSASTETERESICADVTMGTAWHWPWVMLTEGERRVVCSASRANREDRSWVFFEAIGRVDEDGKTEAEPDGRMEEGGEIVGEARPCTWLSGDCSRDDTTNVTLSISMISFGQSL